MIDTKKFIANLPFKPITDSQGEGLEYLLGKLNSSALIKDIRQIAYVLATIKHETANTYKPIKEYGSLAYLKSKPYYPYIGAGYVQITWLENYKRFSDILKIDLVTNPDLALQPEISWKITEIGMSKGLFTGKKLDDYFYDAKADWVNARKIINGLDKAELIADYGKKFYQCIVGSITITNAEIPEAKGLEEIK